MTDKKFNVLNVTCDYYLDSLNDLSKLKYHHRSPKKSNNNVQYTVMRIFGITETGLINYLLLNLFNNLKI